MVSSGMTLRGRFWRNIQGEQDRLPGGVGPGGTQFGLAALGDGYGGSTALDEPAGCFRSPGAQPEADGKLSTHDAG